MAGTKKKAAKESASPAPPPAKRRRRANESAPPTAPDAIPGLPAAATPYIYTGEALPSAIDMVSLAPMAIPFDWGSKASAKAAAGGQRWLARLMGKVDLSFTQVSEEQFHKLFQRRELAAADEEDQRGMVFFDEAGEFSVGDPPHHIRMSNLSAALGTRAIRHASAADRECFDNLVALQAPASSQWSTPFIRVCSSHRYDPVTQTLQVCYALYFSRLVFELISDQAIKCVVENLVDIPGEVIPTEKLTAHRPLFTKAQADLLQLPQYRFSLPGLLKHTENTGYPMCAIDPPGLTVSLYDFQKSSYQWMLDQEVHSRGLNAHFWQEWKFSDGQSMFYFPLAGEFRFDRPPVTRGGLLCEEMGLGKTVEILALILGNPMPPPSPTVQPMPKLTRSRATLIVLPPHLVHQWLAEIEGKISGCKDGSFAVLNTTNLKPNSVHTADLVDVRMVLVEEEKDKNGATIHKSRTPVSQWGDLPKTGSRYISQFVEVRNLSFGAKKNVYLGKIVNVEECDAGCTVDFALFLVADMHDHDVVIATYGDLKSNRNPLFKTIHWHRIVLDECQEIKVATNQIASMCARLAATNRWMVSGTPLVNQVADLHGELNFLQIWPFSLPDVVDGFWELRVQRGYDHRDETSLHLLHSLLSTVMMRHTKSQRYITSGEPLVTLPARTIEFKPFELTDKYERCAYDYIASFAADSLLDFMDDSQLDHTADSTRWRNVPRYAQLRGLMSVMSRCITSAAAIDLRSLDHLRRLLSSRRAAVIANAVGAPGSRDIPVLSAEDVLARVQAAGAGAGGGMNRATDRTVANVKASEEEERIRAELAAFSRLHLMEKLQDMDMPIPMVWIKTRFTATTDGSSPFLVLHEPAKKQSKKKESQSAGASDGTGASGSIVASVDAVADSGDDGGNDEAVRKSLHEMLPPGSTLRVGKTETEEAEMKVQRVFDRRADRAIAGDAALATVTVPGKTEKYAFTPDDLGYVETISKCEAGAMERALLFRRDFASRKEPYIDLLTSRRMSSSGKEYNLGGLHSEGFSTLYKLMAGQPAQCPLCLVEATRPTVTTCVHVFCRDCIADVLNKADEGMGTHKCPMCRRGLCHGDLMEIKMDNVLDETTVALIEAENDRLDTAQSTLEEDPPTLAVASNAVESLGDFPSADETSSRPSEASGGTPPRVWECGSTTFVVPEFNIDSSERLTSAVGKSATELARYCHPQRDVLLPSLSANALHVLRMSTRFLSSRMRALIGDMKETQKTDLFAKFVVFTQYKETAVSARQDLEKHGFKCESIVSQTAGLSTQEALNAFHKDPLCNVLLLTMSSSCNGLTLTIAHVVYLLEPSPSPAAEAQAISRVHRIGQSHNVRCVIFYAKDTCEERLLAMRQRQKALTELLAADSLSEVMIDDEESEDGDRAENRVRLVGRGRARLARGGEVRGDRQTDSYFVGKNLCTLFGLTNQRKEERGQTGR